MLRGRDCRFVFGFALCDLGVEVCNFAKPSYSNMYGFVAASRDEGFLDFGQFGGFRGSRFLSSTLLPFFFRVPFLKPNSRKKGTLIIKGLLRNLGSL